MKMTVSRANIEGSSPLHIIICRTLVNVFRTLWNNCDVVFGKKQNISALTVMFHAKLNSGVSFLVKIEQIQEYGEAF